MLDDLEIGGSERRDDVARNMKTEVQRYSRTEKVFYMHDLVADVKGDQRQAASRQCSPHFEQDRGELVGFEVHDRIEGYYACKFRVWQVESPHVTHLEAQAGVETLGDRHHFRGEIDADDGDALLMEVPADVPGTTTDVGHEAATARILGEPVQEMAVERLARELRREVLGVGLGSGIVTFANVHRRAELGRAVRLLQTSYHEICHLLGREI